MPLDTDVDQDKIASVTHGFVGADLEYLCKEAAMKCLRRLLPELNLEDEKVPPETLEKLVINMNDFDYATREITPSAMREVYVEPPDVKWDDIGGLDNVKRELQEAVEWPMRFPEMYKQWDMRFLKEYCYTDLQEREKHYWQRLWPLNLKRISSVLKVQN